MECAKCLDLLSELIDGTLVISKRKRLAAHIDDCLPCAVTRSDLELIVKLARELRDVYASHIPDSLKSNIFSTSFYQAGAASRQA